MAANPFDFNEVEEKRNFEKNMIFGVSPNDTDYKKTSEFMRTSLAAANMLPDNDEENISNLTMISSTTMCYSKSESNVSDQTKGQSARRHTPKYNSSDLLGSDLYSGSRNSYNDLDDYVMKTPQVSAEEFQALSNELTRAKKMIETLKSERWTNLPVKDTVKRMLTEKDYSLEGYKALREKQELLSSVCKTQDGNAIIVVILFLERTLNKTLFFRELRKQNEALSHYAQHLKSNDDWEKLESLYKDLYRIEDAAAIRYEKICKEEDPIEKLTALQNWVKDYGMKSEISEMASYICDEISLLEQQRQIEAEDKKRQSTNPSVTLTYHPPSISVLNQPVITTVSYCALYHYDKSSKHFPENFKKKYNLTDKQYEWAVVRPRANLHRWDDIAEILTSTNWLKRKSEVSAIGFEHVCTILHKAKANEQIMIKYLSLINNLDIRIKYASRFNVHTVAINSIVQSRDRQKMEEYRLKVGQHSEYRQKINDLLNSTAIKWR